MNIEGSKNGPATDMRLSNIIFLHIHTLLFIKN